MGEIITVRDFRKGLLEWLIEMLISSSIVFLIGCATFRGQSKSSDAMPKTPTWTERVPIWIQNPPQDGVVGSSKESFTEAIQDARDEIAREGWVLVTGRLTNEERVWIKESQEARQESYRGKLEKLRSEFFRQLLLDTRVERQFCDEVMGVYYALVSKPPKEKRQRVIRHWAEEVRKVVMEIKKDRDAIVNPEPPPTAVVGEAKPVRVRSFSYKRQIMLDDTLTFEFQTPLPGDWNIVLRACQISSGAIRFVFLIQRVNSYESIRLHFSEACITDEYGDQYFPLEVSPGRPKDFPQGMAVKGWLTFPLPRGHRINLFYKVNLTDSKDPDLLWSKVKMVKNIRIDRRR